MNVNSTGHASELAALLATAQRPQQGAAASKAAEEASESAQERAQEAGKGERVDTSA